MFELNFVFKYSQFLGVSSGNTSIGNYHGLKKIHMPLTFQQDKGILLNVLIIFQHIIIICNVNFRVTLYNHNVDKTSTFDVSDNPILHVLETRVQDKLAQDFVKRQKQRLLPAFLE